MQYKVTKRFRKYKPGTIVDDSDRYIRRKLAEGGCLEKIVSDEKKMNQKQYENKMVNDISKEIKNGGKN